MSDNWLKVDEAILIRKLLTFPLQCEDNGKSLLNDWARIWKYISKCVLDQEGRSEECEELLIEAR